MISSILLVLKDSGKILLRRDYKKTPKQLDVELSGGRLEQRHSPIETIARGLHCVSLPASDRAELNALVLSALITHNGNVIFILEFLAHLRSLIQQCVGEVTESSIRANTTTLLSVLEESVDYGIPQCTDFGALRPLILFDEPSKNSALQSPDEVKRITDQLTGPRAWRREGIKYKKNEVYIDVVEDVNAIVSHTGDIVFLEAVGHVAVRAMLSGVPECRFGINDRPNPKKASPIICLDDVRFHQCLRKVDTGDRAISFVPPDGSFQLMSYRSARDLILPFVLTSDINQSGSRIQIALRIKAQFPRTVSALMVKAVIPLPDFTARVHIGSYTSGKASCNAEKQAVEWSWKRCPGGTEGSLSFDIDLAPNGTPVETGHSDWAGRGRAPITMSFDLPTVAASGLKVRFMKVQESSGYKTVKWIRYLTRAGKYEVRI